MSYLSFMKYVRYCTRQEHIRRGEILSTDFWNGFHGFCSPNPLNLFQKSADSNPFNSNMLLTSTNTCNVWISKAVMPRMLFDRKRRGMTGAGPPYKAIRNKVLPGMGII